MTHDELIALYELAKAERLLDKHGLNDTAMKKKLKDKKAEVAKKVKVQK